MSPSLDALDLASKQFKNITIDLIYGIPCVSELAWQRDLDYIQEFGIPHVSAYALTFEPKTALAHFINKGSFPKVDEDHQHLQYQMLTGHLKAMGMKHYEVSNFALPGWYSRHNSSYWQGVPYLGFGPSAQAVVEQGQ